MDGRDAYDSGGGAFEEKEDARSGGPDDPSEAFNFDVSTNNEKA